MQEKLKRWRLILGADVDGAVAAIDGGFALSGDEALMDEALAAIYDETTGENAPDPNQQRKQAGMAKSAPRLAKWLGDIRKLFPEDTVTVIQSDAIARKGLKQLLLEPETLKTVKPDISMVSTLMALNQQIPEKAKASARELVKAVVDDLMRRLEQDLRRAVTGALNKRNHSPLPSLTGMDWKTTIRRNLKHYDKERNMLIPERFYFFERMRRMKEWTVILDMDQSGSMAESIIYASVMGAIFAAMPALDTYVVAFDTQVVDLTEACRTDPVDVLFGVQLGGGTDINKSVAYCEQYVTDPKKTLFILISDLFEGGVEAGLLRRLTDLHESGVKVLVLLALSDRGTPSYDEQLGKKVSNIGIPCFACAPERLPELVEAALKGRDLTRFASGKKEK